MKCIYLNFYTFRIINKFVSCTLDGDNTVSQRDKYVVRLTHSSVAQAFWKINS